VCAREIRFLRDNVITIACDIPMSCLCVCATILWRVLFERRKDLGRQEISADGRPERDRIIQNLRSFIIRTMRNIRECGRIATR